MRITILLHESDPRPGSVDYLIWPMCDLWRADGHEVQVLYGLERPVRGDVVILHVDLSVVPPEYIAAVSDHTNVLNRRVVDISKTAFSRNLLQSPDQWDGPVIVKTVLNHGGHPERRHRRRTVAGRLRNLVGKLRSSYLPMADHLQPHHYPVFNSASEVPRGVWSNPALVVERFLPERRGDSFCVRFYSFLGDRYVNELYVSRYPVIRRVNATECHEAPLPEAIVATRREMGFDYGKFDYVIHNGEVVLLDVNRTPCVSDSRERLLRAGGVLGPGIMQFLRQPR